MQSYHEQLNAQALNDLSNRSKSGIVMYLAVWLAIALTFKLNETHPLFFQINTGIFVFLAALRGLHIYAMFKNKTGNISFLSQWFNVNILMCALHWGLMSGWIIHEPSLAAVQTTFLIITPAFALGGACTLSISSEIRILYPTFMFVPVIALFLLQDTTEYYLLAGLCSFALMYIFVSSRASHKDYWEAITNFMVAEERAELMEKLSVTDPLTQIHNRMYFDSEYSIEWRRSLRLRAPLSVIMIDIDYFKKINDTYGHIFGDDCLKIIAKTIAAEAKRPTDRVARYGGEEFVVLLPNTNEAGAQTIGNRIRETVEAIEIDHEGKPVKLTVSVGGATTIPVISDEKTLLIRRADSALYQAKHDGRNRYNAEMSGHC